MKGLLTASLFVFFSQYSISAEICSPLLKTTKYQVQKGDHIALILRKLGLEPVFKKSGSLRQLLKLNKIANQDLIEPNSEIEMPFKCEEQVRKWQTIDKNKYRLITLDQIPESDVKAPTVLPDAQTVSTEPQFKVVTTDQKITDILKPSGTANVADPKDVDLENKKVDEVSEALRYRMICEGEWTGTQCITRYSVLFLAGAGWYNRYDGKDPTAPGGRNNEGLLLSRLNPEVQFGWQNYWTENYKTELSAKVQNSEMLPEAREIPIEQSKKILSSIHLEARYETGAFGIGIGIKNYDKLFYRFRFSGLSTPCLSNAPSFSGCGVFVHSANIMAYFTDFSWVFYQQGKFTYDAKLNFMYLGTGATGGFEVYNGTGADIEFTVRHDRVREYLYGTIHYGQTAQDTSIEVQTAKELGFVMGYAWKLKDW